MNTCGGTNELGPSKPVYADYLSLEQLEQLANMQDELNKLTSGPFWFEKNQAWDLAIFSELNELMDAVGWKWWKKQTPADKTQSFLEVVDIWHFVLSSVVEKALIAGTSGKEEMERTHQTLILSYDLAKEKGNLNILNEISWGFNSTADKDFIQVVARLTVALGFTLQDLYFYYILKNVLNEFRQNNGYKEGTYIKVWQGKEDNLRLENILLEYPRGKVLDVTEVYGELELWYKILTRD